MRRPHSITFLVRPRTTARCLPLIGLSVWLMQLNLAFFVPFALASVACTGRGRLRTRRTRRGDASGVTALQYITREAAHTTSAFQREAGRRNGLAGGKRRDAGIVVRSEKLDFSLQSTLTHSSFCHVVAVLLARRLAVWRAGWHILPPPLSSRLVCATTTSVIPLSTCCSPPYAALPFCAYLICPTWTGVRDNKRRYSRAQSTPSRHTSR